MALASGSCGIAVVIPAFDAEVTIRRALDSAIAQTRRPDEIIVVDDCSADATVGIVAEYASQSVKLISLPQNLGAGGARNVGIKATSCELIAFLDSDDEWEPSKLSKQLQLITSDEKLSFVACASNLVSPSGVDLGDTYDGQPVATGAHAWKALLAENFLATPTILVWRRHLIALGGFNTRLRIGEDQDMWIRLALVGSLGYLPEKLVHVHMREQSLSTWSLSDLLEFTFPMIEQHIAEHRDKLTTSEIRHIRGARLNRFGRVAYSRGDLENGFNLIGHSMLLGYQPLQSIFYLANASPPMMWLKRQLGIGGKI